MQTIEKFISLGECTSLSAALADYRQHHDVPLVERKERKRSLKYQVINGDEIAERLPQIERLAAQVMPLAQKLLDRPIVPLPSRKVAVNVNITPPGGAYRWHYDRNAVTAVLYLNTVEGGEIESYSNYRWLLTGARASRLQGYVDKIMQWPLVLALFGRKRSVPPQPGLLVLMRGDRCLHSVCEVRGTKERICVVMSYDTPEAAFPQASALDTYLYTAKAAPVKGDPNYVAR